MLQLYSFFVNGARSAGFAPMFLVCCLKAMFLLPGVDGHGYLHMPLTRNVVGNQIQTNNYLGWFGPNNYNAAPSVCGGGDNSMMSNTLATSDTMHPLYSGNLVSAKGEDISWFSHQSLVPVQGDVPDFSKNIYNQGDVVTLEVVITAPHYGYFTTHICDTSELSGSVLTNECFLKRPPLKRVYGHPDDKSPLLDQHPERYYFGNNACGNPVQFSAAPPGVRILSVSDANTHRYNVQLPQDLTCDHCVLLWWWHCAQSCTHEEYKTHAVFSSSNIGKDGPGYKGAPNCNAAGSEIRSSTLMSPCVLDSTKMNQVPAFEQFKGCADIKVGSGSSGGGSSGGGSSGGGGTSGGGTSGDGSTDTGDQSSSDCAEVKGCLSSCISDIF